MKMLIEIYHIDSSDVLDSLVLAGTSKNDVFILIERRLSIWCKANGIARNQIHTDCTYNIN